MNPSPWHVSILIPARNEEMLLPRCLLSIFAACQCLPKGSTHDIILVVDCSTDLTRDIAETMLANRGTVAMIEAGAVGCARALAATIGLQRYMGPLPTCWLANTDADCVVPETWLSNQLSLAEQGIEAIAGIVEVDSFAEHDSGVDLRFRESYLIHPDGSHPHVHGANLGIRADAYVRVGGWRGLQTAEDHDLWNRLSHTESRKCAISAVTVLTSGRRVGRAPRGFAEELANHDKAVTC
jgi:glycosyltransferase involved in cell wall biosynthesis